MRKIVALVVVTLGATGVLASCSNNDNNSTAPQAETFRATLNGANERPTPRTTPGTGTADFTFRGDTLRWVVQLANMTNVTASHIHIGDANTAGGILLPLTPGTSGVNSNRIEGFVTRAGYTLPGSPNQGVTFDSLLTLMRVGDKTYVNVHTNNTANDPTNNTGAGDFPAGEIRGQLSRTP